MVKSKQLVESMKYFPLKNSHSFKLIIFNIVNVRFCLSHSSLRNFFNAMPICDPVGAIRQPFRSGSGGEDGVEFIRCVGRREPQIHKLLIFAEDGITRKVYPFTRIDVGNFSGVCFKTDYSTEVGSRVAIYGQRYINGRFKWLDVPAPFCDAGMAWTDNLLVPEARWGDGVRFGAWAWGNQPGFLIVFDVPWHGVFPSRSAYLPRSP